MTSYRAKLFAILGALLAIHQLIPRSDEWKRLSGMIWCDNQAAVDKFNELEGDKPYSITDAI